MPKLADRLLALNAAPVLVLAAERGIIKRMRCAMPRCDCPRGRVFFEKRGDPKFSYWAPSADRWPKPGRDGGTYALNNIRLAHFQCNRASGARIGAANSHRLRQERNPLAYKTHQSTAGKLGGAAAIKKYGAPGDTASHSAGGKAAHGPEQRARPSYIESRQRAGSTKKPMLAGEANPAKRPEVRKKISEALAKRVALGGWGDWDRRCGRCGEVGHYRSTCERHGRHPKS